MKLADWLFHNSKTPQQLRILLGVQNRATIYRYLIGARIPTPPIMQKIIVLTKGQVQLADFLDPSPPKCARFVTDADGTTRMLLPCSPGWSTASPAGSGDGGGGDDDDFPSKPIRRALAILGSRGRAEGYKLFLDGRLTDARRLVKEANRILKERGGEPLIHYPGVWPLA